MNIWFTSDLHGYHRNIAGPKVSQWKSGYRDFEDEKVMTETIVNNINKYVKHDDILYSLGDWSFGHPYNIKRLRDQIHCTTIHHILGNHDQDIRDNKSFVTESGLIHSKDLFSSVQDVLSVKHGEHTFFLSHYAHRVWNRSHRGVIHLYGHSHDSLDKNNIQGYGKSMDVGIDSAYRIFGEYRPFCISDITSIMDKRDIKTVDHHE